MRRSFHLTIDQPSLQRNYSLYRKRRHSAYSTKPPHGATVVEWSDPVAIRCSRCRHAMGSVVVFRVDDRYGVVEDTAKWLWRRSLEPAAGGAPPGKRPHWIRVSGDGYEARVTFRCASCRTSFRARNAHRLVRALVDSETAQLAIR